MADTMTMAMENGTLLADANAAHVDANGEMERGREIVENGGVEDGGGGVVANGGGGEEKVEVLSGRKAKEAERRRRRRTKKKKSGRKGAAEEKTDQSESDKENADELEERVEVEYVSEKVEVDANGNMNPLHQDFLEIFEKFSIPEHMFVETAKMAEPEEAQADEPKKKGSDDSDDSDDEDDDKDKEKGLSNKKKKLQRRMKIAELKQQCMKPDVVEVWDATAADPRLLVFLKGYRNTVPVPRHWCQKRKFLQGAVHLHV